MDITISKNCKDRILYHLSEEFGINVSWEKISSIEILNDSFHVFVKGHGEYLCFTKSFSYEKDYLSTFRLDDGGVRRMDVMYKK